MLFKLLFKKLILDHQKGNYKLNKFTHNTTTVGDSKFQKVQTHLNFVKKLKLLILESTSVCQTNTANITARTYINEHTIIPKTTVNQQNSYDNYWSKRIYLCFTNH